MRGVWCVVRGVWCVVRGAWCVVCGVWCVVPSGGGGAWCLVPGAFTAHRLVYHPTLGSRVINKKVRGGATGSACLPRVGMAGVPAQLIGATFLSF